MIETRTHTFIPELKVVATMPPVVATQAIIDEPVLWGADWEFARAHGGPLTQAVMDSLRGESEFIHGSEARGRYAVIDTEGQHLLVGQFPSIPGWHCDSLPTSDNGPGQHDLNKFSADAVHYTLSVSDQECGVSHTLFAAEPVTIECDTDHLWPSVHRAAERLILRRELMRDGDVVKFGAATLHKPTAAHTNGWRFWFRLSLYHNPPRNVIKKVVQVYTPEESR